MMYVAASMVTDTHTLTHRVTTVTLIHAPRINFVIATFSQEKWCAVMVSKVPLTNYIGAVKLPIFSTYAFYGFR